MVSANSRFKIKVEAASETVSDSQRIFRVGAGIEADNQVRLAEQVFVVFQVVDQILDLALLAAFDCDCDPWVAQTEVLARFHRKHRCEESVSIVGRTTAIQPVVNNNRVCGVSIPSVAIRLFVHMSVHEHLLFRCLLALCASKRFNIDNQERGASFILEFFNTDALDLARFCELPQVSHLFEQVSVDLPLFIEDGRQTLDLNEF
jgi:hypothetical protein